MKKGQRLKCMHSNSNYLTPGNDYLITAGEGDYDQALGTVGGRIYSEDAFNIVDDDGDILLQADLEGLHGSFEVIS